MRLTRFRLRVRTLLAIVAVVALAMVGLRIYRDGPESHWLLLKIRHGNAEARRSAAIQVRESEGKAIFRAMGGQTFSGPANPQILEAEQRQRRRSVELLIPALAQAMNDPDATCRSAALKALTVLAGFEGSESEKSLALRLSIEAMRDREASVRKAAVDSLSGFADRDRRPVIDAIRSALADSSVEVRESAAWRLGFAGVTYPESQPEVASLLIPLLASKDDSRVRVNAAEGLSIFGVDRRRHPRGTGPDVVPALVAALRDPDVTVRQRQP